MRLKEFARQPIEPTHQNPYSAHTYSSPATGLSAHSQISIPYTSIHNKSLHQQYGQNYKHNQPSSQFSQQPHLGHSPNPYVQNQQYPYRGNTPEKESLQDNAAYRIVRGKTQLKHNLKFFKFHSVAAEVYSTRFRFVTKIVSFWHMCQNLTCWICGEISAIIITSPPPFTVGSSKWPLLKLKKICETKVFTFSERTIVFWVCLFPVSFTLFFLFKIVNSSEKQTKWNNFFFN